MKLYEQLLEGRKPPKFVANSRSELDWWQEQVNRCTNGFTYRDTTLTGDHYFFLNFMKIKIVNVVTSKIEFYHPYFSYNDALLYNIKEEALSENLALMLLTSGGWGKSYFTAAICLNAYTTMAMSQTIVSASYDVPADNLMSFIKDANDTLPNQIKQPFLKFTNEYMEAGFKNRDGSANENSAKSEILKVIFGDNSGAVRSKRPTYHVMEEIGNWIGSAGLIDCYNACQARYRRGMYMTCLPILIGTGGKVKAKAAADLKKMFYDAKAYNLKSIALGPEGKPKAIFIPVYKKFTGFYEKQGPVLHPTTKEQIGFVEEDGKCDEEGVKNYKLAVREEKQESLAAYIAETSEYPFEEEELFQTDGGLVLVTENLTRQYQEIYIHKRTPRPELVNLFPVMKNGIMVDVDIDTTPRGKIQMYERPVMGHREKFKHLYCGGYDGIDLGKKDTESGEGSSMAMVIKKRFATDKDTNNIYVADYSERPNDVDDGYEQCSLLMWLYNAMTNIEFSKIGIVPFLEKKKMDNYLMKRPATTVGNRIKEDEEEKLKKKLGINFKVNKLIGTLPTDTNFDLGIQFLQRYIKDYYFNCYSERIVRQWLDYTNEKRGTLDLAVATIMCEIGDDSLGVVIVDKKLPPLIQTVGYYTDKYGVKRYGVIPEKEDKIKFIPRRYNEEWH
jgi:hypothetical protein